MIAGTDKGGLFYFEQNGFYVNHSPNDIPPTGMKFILTLILSLMSVLFQAMMLMLKDSELMMVLMKIF